MDGDAGLGLMIAPKAMRDCHRQGEGVRHRRGDDSGLRPPRRRGISRRDGRRGRHDRLVHDGRWAGDGVPTFGAEPMIGTNPIAVAAPARHEPMFLFDAAMTAIAGNKVGLAARLGHPMQAGWVAHDDGTPDMDGGQFVQQFAAQNEAHATTGRRYTRAGIAQGLRAQHGRRNHVRPTVVCARIRQPLTLTAPRALCSGLQHRRFRAGRRVQGLDGLGCCVC